MTTLRMSAPENQVSITLPDGQIFAPGPDGNLDVPVEYAGELASHGWKTIAARPAMTDAELSAARSRREHLQQRRAELAAYSAEVAAAAAAMDARCGTMREAFAEGAADAEALQDLIRDAGSAAAMAKEAALALQASDAALSACAESIVIEEMNREAAREEAASASLRVDADTCMAMFFDGLDDIASPLRKLHEIRRELARSYPAASQVPMLTADTLARAFEERYSGRFENQLRAGNVRGTVAEWILSVVLGPAPHERPYERTRDLAEIGIVE